jgi:hypothetical protein
MALPVPLSSGTGRWYVLVCDLSGSRGSQPDSARPTAWVDLTTSDPEEAHRFYREMFGWEFQMGPADTGHYTTCLIRGHTVAGMVGEPAPAGNPTAWTTYLASGPAARWPFRKNGTPEVGPTRAG